MWVKSITGRGWLSPFRIYGPQATRVFGDVETQ